MDKKEQILTPEQTKRLKGLFIRYKNGWFSVNKTIRFKQPVLWLIRKGGKVEFYEGVQKVFRFKDSETGEETEVKLGGNKLEFDDFGETFSGYIHYEKDRETYPNDPIYETLETEMLINKIMHDRDSRKAKEIKAWGGLVKSLALIVGLAVAALAVWLLFKTPDAPIQAAQTAAAIANESITEGIQILG